MPGTGCSEHAESLSLKWVRPNHRPCEGVEKTPVIRTEAADRAGLGRSWRTAIDRHPDLFDYSYAEEVVHAATHGLGALLSAVGLIVLIAAALDSGSLLALAAATVYGLTLVACYVSSALYHAVSRPELKRFFLLLDHCAIYLLIAGTYTPIALLLPINSGGQVVALVWVLAGLGILQKIVAYRYGVMVRSHRLSVLLYLGMGWSGLLLGWQIFDHLPGAALAWLVAGGMAYTIGVAVFLAHHIRYHHALWHVLVLAASACHFWLVFSYVLPGPSVGAAGML